MAWIYSAASEDLALRSDSGSDQSLTVRSTATHKEFYCPGCEKGVCSKHQFGMIFQHYRAKCQKLTSSMEDFRARTLVLQDLERAWRESEADYFLRSCGSLMRLSPDSSSWRMCQQSLLGEDYELPQKLPSEGMIVDGVLYPLQKLERRTKEIDGGYLPTPTATNYGSNQGGAQGRIGKIRPSLETMARKNLWPTPTTRERDNNPSGRKRKSPDLSARVGGPLNPQWVEWLMGYPQGWTELKDWAMQWYRSKRKKRSEC